MANTYINKKGIKQKTLAAERYEKIKSRVTFKFDMRKELTDANKRLIKKYSFEINELINRPYTWIKPIKNKKNNTELQRVAGHSGKNPQIKGTFLPIPVDTISGKKPRIRFNSKGVATITYTYLKKHLLSFDMKELLDDPREEILRAISNIDEDKKTRFAIQTGAHMSTGKLMLKEELIDIIIGWLHKYSEEEGLSEADIAKNWLWGVYVFDFKNQAIKPKLWFDAERKQARAGYKEFNDNIKKGEI